MFKVVIDERKLKGENVFLTQVNSTISSHSYIYIILIYIPELFALGIR
jgi:hypothetical protein